MDTEVQPTNPPHENGSKIEESSSDLPGETATNGKDSSKTPPKTPITRETRSRSRTPQKKKEKKTEEETKKFLKTIDETVTVNGHENEKKTRSAEKKTNKEKTKVVEEPSAVIECSSKNGVAKDDVADKDAANDKSPKEPKKSPRKPLKGQEQPIETAEKPKEPETPVDNVEAEVLPSTNTDTKSSDTTKSKPEGEGVEMDPLVLVTDEQDPELQFDENSDMDSGKGSPILSRCKTRRSHNRNIPTPKTPKSTTDSESSEKNSVAPPTPTPENLNDTSDSLNFEDVSTRVEVGSDTTRLEYVASNTSVLSDTDNSYLNYSRDRSMSETLRGLSPRKTIRPLNDSYRQRAFRNNLTKPDMNKSDLNAPYPEHDAVDRIIPGLKRKRSVTPEERKKFKSDSTGFVSTYLASPLSNFRSRFGSDISSNIPKLTSYRDGSKDIHEEVTYSEVVSEEPDKKNRCTLM